MLPDITLDGPVADAYESQCTYRCVVLPDPSLGASMTLSILSQCTYRCVVLPDWPGRATSSPAWISMHLQVRGAP